MNDSFYFIFVTTTILFNIYLKIRFFYNYLQLIYSFLLRKNCNFINDNKNYMLYMPIMHSIMPMKSGDYREQKYKSKMVVIMLPSYLFLLFILSPLSLGRSSSYKCSAGPFIHSWIFLVWIQNFRYMMTFWVPSLQFYRDHLLAPCVCGSSWNFIINAPVFYVFLCILGFFIGRRIYFFIILFFLRKLLWESPSVGSISCLIFPLRHFLGIMT